MIQKCQGLNPIAKKYLIWNKNRLKRLVTRVSILPPTNKNKNSSKHLFGLISPLQYNFYHPTNITSIKTENNRGETMDKNISLEICKNSSFRLFLISSIVCRSNTKNGRNFSLAPLYRSFHDWQAVVFISTLIAATGSNEGIKLAKKIVTDCIVHRVHPATQIRKIKRMNQVIDGLGAFCFWNESWYLYHIYRPYCLHGLRFSPKLTLT